MRKSTELNRYSRLIIHFLIDIQMISLFKKLCNYKISSESFFIYLELSLILGIIY